MTPGRSNTPDQRIRRRRSRQRAGTGRYRPVPPHVRERVIDIVETRQRDEAFADTIERARAALAGHDPWAYGADEEFAASRGARQALDELSPDVAREARQVLQQHLEADNLAAREARARATLDPSWEELDAIERSAGVQDAVAGLPLMLAAVSNSG